MPLPMTRRRLLARLGMYDVPVWYVFTPYVQTSRPASHSANVSVWKCCRRYGVCGGGIRVVCMQGDVRMGCGDVE